VDSGVQTGSDVSVYYDPMLAKLIVWGETRDAAIARLTGALERFVITGIRANVPLLLWIARDDAFRAGDTTTQFLAERLDESLFAKPAFSKDALALAIASLLDAGRAPWRIGGVGMPLRLRSGTVEATVEASATDDPNAWLLRGDIDGLLRVERIGADTIATLDGKRVTGSRDGVAVDFAEPPSVAGAAHAGAAASGRIVAPMPGKIVKVAITQGASVAQHDLLIVLEAMKMEHRIEAPGDGTVAAILVREGQIVPSEAPLVDLQ
jgi:3-methylcrotonyl-CoA carboxylase alpha subunit